MTNETLLALKGDIFVGIKAETHIDANTVVKIKKIIAGNAEFDPEYDLNGDGVINAIDLNLARDIILNG